MNQPHLFRSALPYFGSVLLWREALDRGGFAFRQNEHYQRRTQRNRTVIASAQGRLTLSLPLQAGKHEGCLITEVQLAYEQDWRKQHWRSLVAAYGSAPFWTEFQDSLEELFWRKPTFLWEWNWASVAWADEQMQAGLVLAKADDWIETLDKTNIPLSANGDLAPYPQLFSERTGWLSNLSILDLIMCQGPAAVSYLSSQ